MKVGIFSDIHNHVENTIKAGEVFNKNRVKIGLFCGDLDSTLIIDLLKDWKIPIKAVWGNNEANKLGILRDIDRLNINNVHYVNPTSLSIETELEGRKLVIFHGHDDLVTKSFLASNLYDVVCSGHHHCPKIEKVNNTLWINPGSVFGRWKGHPEVQKGSVAIYDSRKNSAEIIYLD